MNVTGEADMYVMLGAIMVVTFSTHQVPLTRAVFGSHEAVGNRFP